MYTPIAKAAAQDILPGAIIEYNEDYYLVDKVRTEETDCSISGLMSYLDVTPLTHVRNPALSLGRDPNYKWTIYTTK